MQDADPKPVPRMTADEFMDWDGGGHVGKLELVNGKVVAHPYDSATHAIILGNVTGFIGAKARNNSPRFYPGIRAPVRPQVHANDNVRAPDLAVTCLSSKAKVKTFPDPVLIVEVLSPGNQKETWNSIYAMMTIPALAEVLVVDSERLHAEVFRRGEDGVWPETGEIFTAGGTVTLRCLSAELPMAEIYAGTLLV